MLDDIYGVWANKDCELIRTSKFSLLFERAGSTISASLKLLNATDNRIVFDTRAIAAFDTTTRQVTVKAKDLLKGERLLIDDDPGNELQLDSRECMVEDTPRNLVVMSRGKAVEALSKDDNELRLAVPGNRWQNLDLIEKIGIAERYDMKTANADNVGICLQEWGLGSGYVADEQGHVRVITIDTNRHAYIFNLMEWKGTGITYCRAGRIRYDNNGTVFAQNIRLMKNPDELTSFMADDNREAAREKIVINDALFNPDACTFARNGIYWSVKSVSAEQITLHGCGGEEYTYDRSQKYSANMLEWFEYRDYEEQRPTR